MQQLQPIISHPNPKPAKGLLRRIMSLDDDAVDQMVCKRVIGRSGLADEVIVMTTPTAALSYLAQLDNPPIDLILLDVNMPVMDGFEFLQAAHDQLHPGEPFPPVLVMLSSPLGPIHREKVATFDAIKGFLDKPLEQFALERAILSLDEHTSPLYRPPLL